jgi:hypothetical protein
VAYIIKGADVAPAPRSQLARVGTDMVAYGRQRDCYKLALMGNRDMRRLWNDFAAEDRAMARLIVADVEGERQEAAKVAVKVDKRLRAAEKSVGSAGVTKARKRAPAVSRADPFSPASLLQSSDPAQRELARKVLGGQG